jgi:ferritin-like metal-binding protein YciE
MKNPKELFVQMMSVSLRGTERSIQIYQEMSKMAQDTDVKESLEARALIAQTDVTKLENCFKLIGEKPMEPNMRIQEIFVEDFRREVGAIESPVGKLLYILSSANFLTHLRIAGYETMIALADRTGHHGVGVLLESCLADKIAFAERNRRFIRKFAESKIAERMAA